MHQRMCKAPATLSLVSWSITTSGEKMSHLQELSGGLLRGETCGFDAAARFSQYSFIILTFALNMAITICEMAKLELEMATLRTLKVKHAWSRHDICVMLRMQDHRSIYHIGEDDSWMQTLACASLTIIFLQILLLINEQKCSSITGNGHSRASTFNSKSNTVSSACVSAR